MTWINCSLYITTMEGDKWFGTSGSSEASYEVTPWCIADYFLRTHNYSLLNTIFAGERWLGTSGSRYNAIDYDIIRIEGGIYKGFIHGRCFNANAFCMLCMSSQGDHQK